MLARWECYVCCRVFACWLMIGVCSVFDVCSVCVVNWCLLCVALCSGVAVRCLVSGVACVVFVVCCLLFVVAVVWLVFAD